jgi:hypothetical protein
MFLKERDIIKISKNISYGMKKILLIACLIFAALIFGCTQNQPQNETHPQKILAYLENTSYCGSEMLLNFLPGDDDLLKSADLNRATTLNCAELVKYFQSDVPYLNDFVYKTYLFDSKEVYATYIMEDESSELADWHILKIYTDSNIASRMADIKFFDNNKVFVATNKNGFDWAGWKSGNKVIMIEGHGVKELYPRIVESILKKLPSDTQ